MRQSVTSLPVTFTPHARQRCAELGVSRLLVEQVIARPDVTHPDRRFPDRVHYRGTEIIAVVAETSGTVITVLLTSSEWYVHGRDRLAAPPVVTGEAA